MARMVAWRQAFGLLLVMLGLEASSALAATGTGLRSGELSIEAFPDSWREFEKVLSSRDRERLIKYGAGRLPREDWQVRVELPAGGLRDWDGVKVVAEGAQVDNACASATFIPVMALFGWNLLSITTSPACPDAAQAYSAGYAEGRLTWQQIWQNFQNEFGSVTPSAHLQEYVAKNMEYISGKVAEYSKVVEGADELEASFWWQVGLVLAQVAGLERGYASVAPAEYALQHLDFLLLSLHGDIYDLQAILALAAGAAPGEASALLRPGQESGSSREWRRVLQGNPEEEFSGSGKGSEDGPSTTGRGSTQEGSLGKPGERGPTGSVRQRLPLVYPDSCSSLVKLLPGFEDLLISQATWTRLETMLRVFKAYSFSFRKSCNSTDTVPGSTVTFSSYPGRLFSGDDFYVISSGLVVQETTIGNDNAELYKKYVKPEGSVLEWMRNMVANRLAASGEEWVAYFSLYNSGTYNNQWMVIDTKKFTAGEPPAAGTLWVLEQLPGNIEAEDKTAHLVSASYWASYNIPAFPSIFNLSGFAKLQEEYGDYFSHEANTRARMFRRDQATVVDIPSLQRLMRYNDFRHDPLSRCDCTPPYSAHLSIAARGDLNPANGSYPLPYFGRRDHGETDTKLTSSKLLSGGKLVTVAISGPTWDQQPPFQWSTSPFSNVTHLGHPDLFLFPWVGITT